MKDIIETIIGYGLIISLIIGFLIGLYRVKNDLESPNIHIDKQIRYNDNKYRIINIEEQEDKLILNVYKLIKKRRII